MTRINTNVASLRGQRSLAKSDKMLASAMTRLSTGVKINNGKDNPSGLIAGETLRGQVATIEQSIVNSNRANNVLTTADGALGEIGGLLTQVRGLVQEGLNDGALSQEERDANQLQIDNALTAINRISSNTSFAGDKLLDGSKAFTTNISLDDSAKLADVSVNEALLGGASSVDLNVRVTDDAEKASLLYGGGTLGSDTVLEVQGSAGREVISLGEGATTADTAAAVNAVSDATGVEASILDGRSTSTAATASSVVVGDGTSDFTVTRAAAGNDETLGTFSIVSTDTGAAAGAPTAALTTDDDGNSVLTITRSTDGAQNTAANFKAAIDAASGGALTTTAPAAGTAGEDLSANTSAQLAGGTDAGTLTFSDIREDTSAGAIGVEIADSGNATGGNVTIAVSGTDVTITADQDVTQDQIAAAVAANEDASALLAASVGGDGDSLAGTLGAGDLGAGGGALQLKSSEYGSDAVVEVNTLEGSFGTFTAADPGASTTRDVGADVEASINGQKARGRGLEIAAKTSQFDVSFTLNEASNVADETASVSITGGGATFQIGQDVSTSGQIGIGIDAVNTARLGGTGGKLYELGSGGGKSLSDIAGGSASGADAVEIIETAINEVSTLRGRIGAVQKNVIDTNINTLGVALENISEARSQIVDTDFAVESANLTKAQILGQAATSVLSIANQSPNRALSLLG